MENATKALLIAGSVLIAIVLIAVGLKILGSTQGTIDQVDNVSDMMEKSIFNSQFEQYEGRQNYSKTKQLINNISINNNREGSYKIVLKGEDYDENGRNTGGGTVANKQYYISNLSKYSYFDVELEYGTDRPSE